jgi:hypothetical protein
MKAVGALLVFAGVAFAGAFWDSAGPESWTGEQIQELLSDSPWARAAEVRFIGQKDGSRIPGVGSPGGRGRRGGGSPVPGGGGWPGAGGGIGFPLRNQAQDSDDDTTVVWTSALPVRQALARTGVVEQLRDVYAKDFYIVTIDGLPLPLVPLAETPDVIRQSARLERKDRPAIRAERVEVRPRPGAAAIELYFPRDAGLSADEKTIEFHMAAGDYTIQRKFKLGEMVYRGRLEM